MRRVFVAVLGLALAAATAQAADIGVGPFGGLSIPVLNDLSKSGTTFGIRVPVNLIPLLTVEPFYAGSSLGDAEETFGTPITYTRDGGKTTGFGVNALFTFGTGIFKFYPLAGIGSYKFERSGAAEISEIGYNFGLGLGLSPIPKLTVHVRGELNMITNGDTAVKAANATVGATYAVFSLP
jgi:hypothetical protein